MVGQAPMYTNTFLLISDAGHGVVKSTRRGPQPTTTRSWTRRGPPSPRSCAPTATLTMWAGAMELKQKWGAKLWCEAADLEGSQFYPLSEADSGYQEGGTIQVDEMIFTVWHTPGHTPGSVCLLCENYLFTGDTLFAGSVGRTDLPGGSSRQLSESLKKLAGLPIPADAQVLPGHGELSTFGEELNNNWYLKHARA